MTVSAGVAHDLAEALTTIPDCPRSAPAVKAIAKDLIRICKSDKEAQQLVNTARDDWDSWKGTVGLIEILRTMRRQGQEGLPLERRVIDLGVKPPVNCAACQDWGYIWRAGRNEYCSCAASVQAESDGIVELLNRKKIRGVPSLQTAQPRGPVTEADLEHAFLNRQSEVDAMIARANAVLEDVTASADEKELARETIRTLRSEE